MANEYVCSDCGGDGTRCGCHRKRKYHTQNPNYTYDRSAAYNKLHGTNFANDASLQRYLENGGD